jgi:hypothetical protein
MNKRDNNMEPPSSESADPLIDEVRAIRRAICNEFGNDETRLVEHLQEVEREYAERRGIYARVTKETAARVAESWGPDANCTDDPLVDEVRAIRRRLAERKP